MTSSQTVLKEAGAVLTNDHFVYNSRKHGSAYVNKDGLYPNPDHIESIAQNISRAVRHRAIEVVIAPAVGAVKLEMALVRQLRYMTKIPVLGAYAEQDQTSLVAARDEKVQVTLVLEDNQRVPVILPVGSELVVKLPKMVLKRGYADLVPGKRVLVAEDILTTGASAKRTVDAVRRHGGIVVGVAAICNRGKVTAAKLDVDYLHSEVDVDLVMYEPDRCPLCAEGKPVNTQYGHGKKFIEEQAAQK